MRLVVPPISLAFAITVGCGGHAMAQTPATALEVAVPSAIPGALQATAGAAGTYERKGRRDPFESVQGLHPDMTSPSVASARLKGILRGAALRALVETADGLGYILKVGEMLGDGRLVEINADSVVFIVPGRQATTNRIVLRLPDD
jgi:hypothetical protein